MNYPPCENPHCKSYGKPHPNCRCYAKGGCIGKHAQDCEYFLEGGMVQKHFHEDKTIGHSAVSHGLLGILKNVGRSKVAEPDKHVKLLKDVQDAHAMQSDGVGIPQKEGMHSKLAKHLGNGEHEQAAEMLHGHPLMGSGNKTGMKHALETMGPAILSNEPNPNALRSSADYLNSAVRGDATIKSEVGSLFSKQKSGEKLRPDQESRKQLKEYLDKSEVDPSQLLEVGGNIGHYLPDHAAAIGSFAAIATNYLNSIKPKAQQMGPMDRPLPPDKADMANYDRQVDIAQNPRLLFQHVKDGTLVSQDVLTVKTIYPALYSAMTEQAAEAIIDAQTKKIPIPYNQRQTLSLFMNAPLDMTQTPTAMKAIMTAQGPQQQMNQQAKQNSQDKATDVEMKAIDKADKLSETPLEARMIKKVSK